VFREHHEASETCLCLPTQWEWEVVGEYCPKCTDGLHQAKASLSWSYWLLRDCASLYCLLILRKDASWVQPIHAIQLSVQKVCSEAKCWFHFTDSFFSCWAETVIPEDYLDAANMKRYSADPTDSAFSCVGSVYAMRQSPADGHPAGGSSSSCGHRPAPVSSGRSSSAGLRHHASSPTRNGTYSEGNTSGNIISSY